MKFSPITSIEVTLDMKEIETIRGTQKILSEIIDKMSETSLNTAECQIYDDIYNIDKEELLEVRHTLDILKCIINIC